MTTTMIQPMPTTTASHPAFEVSVVCMSSRWRILFRGELDLRSGRDLIEVAGVLAASGVAVVEIDLADVTFVDTAGWHAVASARRVLSAHGASTVVAALSPAVTRLLDALHPDRATGAAHR